MTHAGMWHAIDKLAARLGLSCSGLAKACGLDATTFNRSKRWSRDGKPRWLSMNTISKVVAVASHSIPLEEVARLLFID